MTTLATSNGTFEADTIEACVKLEKVAARKAAKEEKAREQLRNLARLRAEEKAWWIVGFKLEGRECPRGWILHNPDSRFSPTKVLPQESRSVTRLAVENEDGAVEIELYCTRFIGTVENGSGCTIALVSETDGTRYVHTVGINQGEHALVLIPGYTGDEFRRSEPIADVA